MYNVQNVTCYSQGLFYVYVRTYILTRIFNIVLNTYDDELKVEIVEVESSEFEKRKKIIGK